MSKEQRRLSSTNGADGKESREVDGTKLSTHPLFDGIEMGLGTWAWGDRLVWGYGKSHNASDVVDAFDVSVKAGIRLLDTAEIYGQGKSERHIGDLLREKPDNAVLVASKFMPFPWRLGKGSFDRALRNSLKRLGMNKLDLYQIHFPLPPGNVRVWMSWMSEAVKQGLVGAVGVSNFNLDQTRTAYEALVRDGYSLASNQVEYHLLDRRIEKNGLLDLCFQLGIKVIAYSPLAMGMLTGKYTPENPPSGHRQQKYNREFLMRIKPLLDGLRQIGEDRGGKTPAQVALNWTICKGTLPIPGAKNGHQAEMNAGALGWRLTSSEMDRLDDLSDKVTSAK
jgi:aryl-alcohol dehydrogenase-like predicted oxidoreductase